MDAPSPISMSSGWGPTTRRSTDMYRLYCGTSPPHAKGPASGEGTEITEGTDVHEETDDNEEEHSGTCLHWIEAEIQHRVFRQRELLCAWMVTLFGCCNRNVTRPCRDLIETILAG